MRMWKVFCGVAISTVLFCVCGSVLAVGYSGGVGTAASPYQIANPADWQELMDTPTDWDKHFVFVSILDLSGIAMTPVGNTTTKFTGVLDGAGFGISGVRILRPDEDYIGLFGYVGNPAEIRNLGLRDHYINGRHWVGGLVGRNDYGRLEGIYIAAYVVAEGNYAGGIVGANNYPKGTVSGSYSAGRVFGGNYVGGLAGYNAHGTFETSYSLGGVEGNQQVGGLIGWNNGGTVQMCYSIGSVLGDTEVGGLVGKNDGGTVTASFWSIQESGQTASDGGIGVAIPVQMRRRGIFADAGWDFIHVWGIGQHQTTPYFRTTPAADINGDGVVNLEDLAIMAAQWLTGEPVIAPPAGLD